MHGVPLVDGAEVPDHIAGVKCYLQDGVGLRVQCPTHFGCARYRSLRIGIDRFGPGAAKLYIATWLDASTRLGVDAHRAFRPNVADIDAYIATL